MDKCRKKRTRLSLEEKFKARLMLRVILKDVETRIERQQIYSSNTRGLNGLEQGYDTNMLDVCRLSNKAWNEIENEKIARCWVRAHCLSHSQENCWTQIYGHLLHESNTSDVLEVIAKLQKLKIIGECHSTKRETKDACDEWVAIEENSNTRLAIISSLLDEDLHTME